MKNVFLLSEKRLGNAHSYLEVLKCGIHCPKISNHLIALIALTNVSMREIPSNHAELCAFYAP